MILPAIVHYAGHRRALPGIFYWWLPILFSAIFLSPCLPAQTLSVIDTARGSVGDEMFMSLLLKDTDAAFTVRGIFKLSNPTVFYPRRFVADSTSPLSTYNLQRQTDSTYAFSFTGTRLQQSIQKTDIHLWGEALAGSDSLCTVLFDSLSINNTVVSPVNATIITTSIGTALPYVRFATLEVGYPNPTAPGIEITWAYRIDKTSTITFIAYDVLGREIKQDIIEKQTLGVHLYHIVPNLDFPAGVYTLRMKTNSGEAVQRFVVVN